MSLSLILEVAIGLGLVYYILGSIVSIVTQMATESLETRGVALEKYLKVIAGDKAIDLTSMHQIKALRPIRYKNWFSVFTSNTEPKMVEKIPAATLVDAFFDMAGLTANKELSADELTNLINQLPESDGKQAILSWIQRGVTNINDIRTRTNAYFCGILDQAASRFKANARSIVIIFSIGITLFFGVDSIQLAKDMWASAELRSIAAIQANAAVQGGGPVDLTSLLNGLGSLTIKIGWWRTQILPQNGSIMDWVSFVFLKFIGLSITTLAVSQGSSFWYDLLKKLTSPTSSSSSASSSGGGGSSRSSSSSSSSSDSG